MTGEALTAATHEPRPTIHDPPATNNVPRTTINEMDAKRVEIIVLPADNELPSTPTGERRKASQLLRGTVVLRDDLITPPIPEEDWDALK